MKKLLTIVLLFCLVHRGQAQQVPPALEQQLENLAETAEEETEDDTYLQQLQYYTVHPLNLNAATAEDLQVLKLLTPLQIDQFLRYRNLFQNLISIYELQAVPLWDVSTIRKLLPYITVASNVQHIGARFTKGDHLLLLRNTRVLQQQKGFDTALPTHFSGDRNHLLLRYNYQYKNELQYGITGDKDAGENFFRGGQRSGFDFYSAHFFVRKLGIVKALALGDFTVNMGQGLIQWQALAFKKSAEPMAVLRQAPTLAPYRAAGEFYFNRGAGITLQKGHWETTVFGSWRNLSANLAYDSVQTYFTSFSTSGLHRTPSELQDKNTVLQTSFGSTVKFKTNRFSLAVNTVQYQFSKPLQKRDDAYNLFAISGTNWNNSSVDYTWVYKNVYLFGEAAVDRNSHTAFVNGLIASVDPKVDVSVVHRHIAPDYQAVYGNAFTEATAPANESGLYLGVTIRPAAAWRINSYADFFKFPWLKYRIDAPSGGQDYLLQVMYQPSKVLELYARYRQETKALNDWTPDSVLHFSSAKMRQNIRLNLVYKTRSALTLKARAEALFYDAAGPDAETGFMLFVEGGYGILKKLKGNLRLQYFNTGGYNSRIYAYESDVLYSYSVPAFFDTGVRGYFNLQYNGFKNLSVWVRYAQTVYQNQKTIGSGLNSTNGNTISELKCQVSYRF